MYTKELISELAKRFDKPQSEMRLGVQQLMVKLKQTFTHDQSFTMTKFGTFYIHKKKRRRAFNPLLKRFVLLPPKVILRFRAARALKEGLQKERK